MSASDQVQVSKKLLENMMVEVGAKGLALRGKARAFREVFGDIANPTGQQVALFKASAKRHTEDAERCEALMLEANQILKSAVEVSPDNLRETGL